MGGVTGLPVGAYRLVVTSHRNQWIKDFTVKVNATNDVSCEFVLGAVQFVTMPPGANVRAGDGSILGKTPLLLTDQQPQTNSFTLEMSGYESATVSVEISGAQTNLVQTNLVSLAYANAMRSAQSYLTAGDFERAAAEIKNALIAKPDDGDALKLQSEASVQFGIKKAKSLAAAGNYIEAGKILSDVLSVSPENDVAKGLFADYKQRASVQIDRQNSERLNRPQAVLDSMLIHARDPNLFDNHVLKTPMLCKDVDAAIYAAFQNQPGFKVKRHTSPLPETFFMDAMQDIGSGGERYFVIAGAQTKDDETQILFKVMEYKTKHNVSMTGLLAFEDDKEAVAINPARLEMTAPLQARLAEGVATATTIIQGALGQSPAPAP